MRLPVAFVPVLLALGCSSSPVASGVVLTSPGTSVASTVEAFATASGEPVVIDNSASRFAHCSELSVHVPRPMPVAELATLLNEALAHDGFLLTRGSHAWQLSHSGSTPSGCDQLDVRLPERLEVTPVEPEPSPAQADAASVTVLGEREFEVTRATFDTWFAGDQWMSAARFIPHEEDGVLRGITLYGIRRGSHLGLLGFQNGDLAVSVNGRALNTPDALTEVGTEARTASSIDVEIERDGVPIHIVVRVRD